MKTTAILSLGVIFPAVVHGGQSDGTQNMQHVVAIWLFDEGSGRRVTDSSGHGHEGLFKANPRWVDGKFGKALSFNGLSDYVETSKPVVVDSINFSIGFWVNPGKTQKKWANILSSHQEPPRRGISFEQDDDHENGFHVPIGDGTNWNCRRNAFTQLIAGSWQHFAVVRKGTKVTYYLNGKVSGEEIASNLPVVAATSNFRIGNWVLGGREWSGTIDEVFIFKRALNLVEITGIMNRGLTGARTAADPTIKRGAAPPTKSSGPSKKK